MLEEYNRTMERLFSEWEQSPKHIGKVFNYDGIVNPEIWFSDKQKGKRILFVLKEAYHDETYKEPIYDLCSKLRNNEISSPTWKCVAEWGYGILNTSANVIAEYQALSFEEQKGILNQIAVMNLKKSDGNSYSDENDILTYVEEDLKRLREQFDAINPDIIVCGNTFKGLNQILDNAIKKKRDAIDTWVYRWKDKLIIDYYHPANQFPALLNYYGITTLYHLALKKMITNNI